MRSLDGVVKKNELVLCDICGGTGLNINDTSMNCPKCNGLRIINRFTTEFTIDIPYTNERDRNEIEYKIRNNVVDILKKFRCSLKANTK